MRTTFDPREDRQRLRHLRRPPYISGYRSVPEWLKGSAAHPSKEAGHVIVAFVRPRVTSWSVTFHPRAMSHLETKSTTAF